MKFLEAIQTKLTVRAELEIWNSHLPLIKSFNSLVFEDEELLLYLKM